MRRSRSAAQVAIQIVRSAVRPNHPYEVTWYAPNHFVQRHFETREEAIHVAQEVALGKVLFDKESQLYKAKYPFPTSLPTTGLIETWIDAADVMLMRVLAKRGAV